MNKYIALFLGGLALAINASAQAPAPAPAEAYPVTFVKGDLNIKYDTRTNKRVGAVDTYNFNVNVSNSAKFAGTITQLPFIPGTLGSSYGAQAGLLTYDLKCDVVNPKNPAQTRNVGKIYGVVPVSEKNVYDFNQGNLKTQVFAAGAAKGFDSKFSGVALGKPPTPSESFLSKLKRDALVFTKQVGGQVQRISVTKYDVMQFNQHVLAAGPVQIYGEVTVSGQMVYDYDRASWYFQRVSVMYWDGDRQINDVISGDIRWVEDDNRRVNGIGEYQFDIRLNEKPLAENAVYATAQTEADFFTTDAAVKGLTGTMKYKDAMSGGSPTSSVIDIDLKGNQLTKQQAMVLCKLLLFTMVVPLNAE